ncbi:DUF3574 domain-containing protein [Sorangium sp. So ce429]
MARATRPELPLGEAIREDSRQIMLLHDGGQAASDGVEALREEYERRFDQSACCASTSPSASISDGRPPTRPTLAARARTNGMARTEGARRADRVFVPGSA